MNAFDRADACRAYATAFESIRSRYATPSGRVKPGAYAALQGARDAMGL